MKSLEIKNALITLVIIGVSLFAYDRFRVFQIVNRAENEFKIDKTRLDSAVRDSLHSINEISALKSEIERMKNEPKN